MCRLSSGCVYCLQECAKKYTNVVVLKVDVDECEVATWSSVDFVTLLMDLVLTVYSSAGGAFDPNVTWSLLSQICPLVCNVRAPYSGG